MQRTHRTLTSDRRASSARGGLLSQQRAGGIAALYLAVAYLATIPYFLLVLDYWLGVVLLGTKLDVE